ncbi:hypothetical protein [Vibrio diazotrophicus]|nr:hypothetical protein [Vibrio diazotrophicus]
MEVKTIYITIGPSPGGISLNSIDITGKNMKDIVQMMKSIDRLWAAFDIENINEKDLIDSELSDKKEEINKLNETINVLNLSISELEETNEISKKQLESTRVYLSDDRKELERTKAEVNKNKELERSFEKGIEVLSTKLTKFETDIDDKSAKLESVKRELEEFQKKSEFYSEDFSAYKEELKKQNTIYVIFLAVFSICLIWVINNIYSSAISLVDNYQFNFDLWSLLVSRLPIISINIVILGIISTLLYQSINLITANFDKVASLKQIPYLVKECIDSQSIDLSISQENLLKARIEKKMELIREHINK